MDRTQYRPRLVDRRQRLSAYVHFNSRRKKRRSRTNRIILIGAPPRDAAGLGKANRSFRGGRVETLRKVIRVDARFAQSRKQGLFLEPDVGSHAAR